MAFSGGGATLAALQDGQVCLRDVAAGRQTAAFPVPGEADAVGMALSPDGSLLAIFASNSRIDRWSTSAHQRVATLTGPGTHAVTALAFSPDGAMLAAGNLDDSTDLWDVATHQRIASLADPVDKSQAIPTDVGPVAFNAAGTMLAVGDSNIGFVYQWRVPASGG